MPIKKPKKKVSFLKSMWIIIVCFPVYILFFAAIWFAAMLLIAFSGLVDIRSIIEFNFFMTG